MNCLILCKQDDKGLLNKNSAINIFNRDSCRKSQGIPIAIKLINIFNRDSCRKSQGIPIAIKLSKKYSQTIHFTFITTLEGIFYILHNRQLSVDFL